MSRVITKTDLERFEEKLERLPICGCWIWVGAATHRYGSFYYPSYPKETYGGMVSAHKSSLWLYKRQLVPEGFEVLHSCDIGFCCNPNHLSVGTHKENMRDMANKNRNVPGGRVLSVLDSLLAKNMRREGIKIKDIAEHFGMSISRISRLTAGIQEKWKKICPNLSKG